MTNPLEKLARQHVETAKTLEAAYGLNYEAPALRFSINVAEAAVISKWLNELKPRILEKQGKPPLDTNGEPYYGAIGGGVTYSFTPTGLGDILVVTEAITGEKLNVTEALDWHFFG